MKRATIALGSMLFIVGCAGRAPAPVSVVQAQDRYMDCTAIMAEVADNNRKVQESGVGGRLEDGSERSCRGCGLRRAGAVVWHGLAGNRK